MVESIDAHGNIYFKIETMNIAFLLHTYPGIGGTETVSNMLANYFLTNISKSGKEEIIPKVIAWKRGKKHHVNVSCADIDDVFYLPDSNSLDTEENLATILHYVQENRINIIINQGPFWRGSRKLQAIGCRLISVLHYAPSFRIDNQRNVIERLYHTPPKGLLSKLKTSVRYCFKEYFAKRDFKKTDFFFFREVVDNSDAFVVLCPAYINEWKRLLKLKDAKNIIAIPNPIRKDAKQNSDNNTPHKTILFVGRLTAWDKRIDRLLDIWNQIYKDYPDWECCIVGDGEERSSLERQAKEMKLQRITFTGFQNPNPYYQAAGVLCLTSSTEGFAMVILEAAAYGCPTVAYGVSSGIKEMIIDAQTGFIIPPFNQQEYIKKLKLLMDNATLREKMGKNAHSRLRSYEIDAIGNHWLSLFNKILKKNEG